MTDAWESVVATPVFGATLTLAAYVFSRWLWSRLGQHPVANPVLVSIAIIGATLHLFDVSYDEYLRGAGLIGLFLGPATVALGLLLYREIELVGQAVLPTLLGVAAGASAAIVSAYALVIWLGGEEQLALTMAPKSATTPVSIALADAVGGIPSLTAVFTILAGIVGATVGPLVLNLLRIRDPRIRGLAVGVSSHGVGTARMLHESDTEGAFSGLAMALTTIVTAVALPLFLLVL
ncbi:MAG TPA: LrgB family protein [Nocardioidaceae bacterium]|nr:LrgB family protein [Nocardioidaceae bacterium]